MRFSDIANFAALPAGHILRVVDDGGFLAGHGAQFKRVVAAGYMAEVVIKGVVYWISVERLSL